MKINLKISLKTLLLYLPYLLLGLWLLYPDFYSILRGARISTVTDMENQNKVTTQEKFRLPDGSIRLKSPENSIALNFKRYKFKQYEYDSAEIRYINPIKTSEEIYLKRGQNRFETFCVPCHGHDGRGYGLIISKPVLKEDEEGFPQPADLTSERTKQLSDSRLFHILSAGQNLMFPVNEKLTVIDKWCVILYIRKLQQDSQK